MPDPRLAKWAAVLVDYSTAVQAGDVVAIVGGLAAAPLLRQIGRAVLRRGGHPVYLPSVAETQGDLLELGSDAQLDFISPVERFARAEADVAITIMASTNTRHRSTIDPERQRRWAQARAELRAAFFDRAAAGTLRWSLSIFPTPAYAQDADMGTDEFAELVYAACKIDQPDPVAAWMGLSARQAQLISYLTTKHDVHLIGPDTDLRLSVAGRSWINSDGKRNFPSGEIFTGPIEDSATGQVRFSYPMVTDGREISDVRLKFDQGVVIDATATRNEAYLHRILETDDGARRLGEFAFGTNYDLQRFTKNTLLDEKIGGTVHMALGSGYPDTGSVNRSAVHWDLISDLRQGGRVEVDGEVFLEDGRFPRWDESATPRR
jgi:aminopeptidase